MTTLTLSLRRIVINLSQGVSRTRTNHQIARDLFFRLISYFSRLDENSTDRYAGCFLKPKSRRNYHAFARTHACYYCIWHLGATVNTQVANLSFPTTIIETVPIILNTTRSVTDQDNQSFKVSAKRRQQDKAFYERNRIKEMQRRQLFSSRSYKKAKYQQPTDYHPLSRRVFFKRDRLAWPRSMFKHADVYTHVCTHLQHRLQHRHRHAGIDLEMYVRVKSICEADGRKGRFSRLRNSEN